MSLLSHLLFPVASLFTPLPVHAAPPPLHLALRTAPRVGTRSLLHHRMRVVEPVQAAPRMFTVADSYAAIHQAALRWGVSEAYLDRVAMCESGMSPTAYNPSGASGLAQFMPATFAANAARIGERGSLWNPYAAGNVMGYMFARGESSAWSCA